MARKSDVLRAVTDTLDKRGVDWTIEQGQRHLYVCFRQCRFPLSRSSRPGHRTILNARAAVRRLLETTNG